MAGVAGFDKHLIVFLYDITTGGNLNHQVMKKITIHAIMAFLLIPLYGL